MRWQGGEQSENIEDRRGSKAPVMVGGGIMTVVLLLVVWLLGGDPLALLQQMQQGQPGGGQPGPLIPGGQGEGPGIDDQAREFVGVVLKDTEDVWREQFRRIGRQYRDPILVVFSDATPSACGYAQPATGPFYGPVDQQASVN